MKVLSRLIKRWIRLKKKRKMNTSNETFGTKIGYFWMLRFGHIDAIALLLMSVNSRKDKNNNHNSLSKVA